MITLSETHRAETATAAPPDRATTVWGLRPEQLHDAYWASSGVQCIRRGGGAEPDPAADLYLLVDGDGLVLFDLAPLAERLSWRAAPLTRLRIIPDDDRAYDERVELDDEGAVVRIRRRYRATSGPGTRVLLTPRARLARKWARAGSRRDGLRAVRRGLPVEDIDRLQISGRCFTPRDGRAFVNRLVRCWRRPDRAIDRIREAGPGVFSLQAAPHAAVVGPAWLGAGRDRLPVGDWCAEDAGDVAEPVRIRPIAEVVPPVASRRVAPPAPSGGYQRIKRAIDLAVSGAGLLVAAPLMAIVALAIVLDDPGAPFFGHLRQGRGGRPFRCWKFRTMRRDAEGQQAQLARANQCDGPQFYIEDDPRVTRVGRLLRRTHLDELPQLFNVLVGHMSLVGPRPSPDCENQFCPAWRELRLSVRPGITGLWQVRRTRRPGLDFQEWIRFDVEYVRRASLGMDLRILVHTAGVVLGRERAQEEAAATTATITLAPEPGANP